MTKKVRDMVDSITSGDLSAANDAFDEILAVKRADGWAAAKQEFARTTFDEITPEVTHEPVDTGITGEPEESEEE
jgi:hypothetical protein